MPTPNPKVVGRMAPVRLTDVPLPIRRRVGNRLIERARLAGNLIEAIELENAVERPDPRIRWVPEHAVRRVLG